MRPYEEPIVTFRVMLKGYCEASNRFQLAATQSDPIPCVLSLFEALNWTVALDDRCGAHWVPDGEPLGPEWLTRWRGDARIARALRFARNRVHHQWAEALELSLVGVRSPLRDPIHESEWYWRAAADLAPAPGDRQDATGKAAYEKLLADRPAESTLSPIRGLYSQLADLMEPRLAPDHATA